MSVAPGLCPSCGRVAPMWTPAAILDACRTWEREHGRAPSADDWENSGHGHPSAFVVRKVFGSFPAAILAAGLVPRTLHQSNSPRHWDRKSSVQALFEWVYEHRGIPCSDMWGVSTMEHPSRSQIRRLFGSWNEYIADAGYVPRRARSDRRCIYCAADPCGRGRMVCEKHADLPQADPKYARKETRASV